MDITKLYQILRETTVQFRKGEIVQERHKGAIHVTEIFAMPHESEAPDDMEKVDLHFVVIGVKRSEAEARRADLVELLAQYPQPDRLAGGPSFIEVGARVEDQGAALCLFALGQTLGLWRVVTPESLGITGPGADELAGRGMVMISGYTPQPAPRGDSLQEGRS